MNACHARPTPLVALLLSLAPLGGCRDADVQAQEPEAAVASLVPLDAIDAARTLAEKQATKDRAPAPVVGGEPPHWAQGFVPIEPEPIEPAGVAVTRETLAVRDDLPAPLIAVLLGRADAWVAAALDPEPAPYRGTLHTSIGPHGALRLQLRDRGRAGSERQLDLLIDPRTSRWTPCPIETVAQLGLDVRRNVALLDIDGDGSDEFCTEAYFHNGTATHRYERTWWRANEDLSVDPVLVFAFRDVGRALGTSPYRWVTVERSLGRNPAGELVVRVDFESTRSDDPTGTYGFLRLWREPTTGAYGVAERWIEDDDERLHVALRLGARDGS